jgi:hypothetical protein
MTKPTSSHLPGLEYALTLLGDERNLQAYTAKLTEATGLAQAAVEREARVEPPLDYVPPIVAANVKGADELAGRPRDYVVEAPGTPHITATVNPQGKVMTTLAGACMSIVTIHKMFSVPLTLSDWFWHIVGAGFFLLCTFYFPVMSYLKWRGKNNKTHDETVKK